MVDRGEFLEWAEYYGQLYGTSRAFVEEHVAAGRDVILDIDVNGARQVKAKIQDAIAVFILPPSFAELERRLRSRRLRNPMKRFTGGWRSPEARFLFIETTITSS